jgi:hypothetical protein
MRAQHDALDVAGIGDAIPQRVAWRQQPLHEHAHYDVSGVRWSPESTARAVPMRAISVRARDASHSASHDGHLHARAHTHVRTQNRASVGRSLRAITAASSAYCLANSSALSNTACHRARETTRHHTSRRVRVCRAPAMPTRHRDTWRHRARHSARRPMRAHRIATGDRG